MLLILESLSLSSLVNTFEQWAIRRSLGGEVERERASLINSHLVYAELNTEMNWLRFVR